MMGLRGRSGKWRLCVRQPYVLGEPTTPRSASKSRLSHKLVARNDAVTSENKIHDDDVAKRFGFSGGLVPGVTVFGYMTWPAAKAWGREWLEGRNDVCPVRVARLRRRARRGRGRVVG